MSHPFEDSGDGYYCAPPCNLIKSNPIHEDPPEPLPDLPYAGTSGWAGSETSRERAEDADADGTTTERQTLVLGVLDLYGSRGVTWKELDRHVGWNHHGKTSGVLSVLHKTGRIERLAETRDRCRVYVAPGCVDGRETESHGGKAEARLLAARDEGWTHAREELCATHRVHGRCYHASPYARP